VTLNDWKRLEITQVIMAEFKRRQELLKEELADQAGLDPLADRQKVGAIKAYQDFLDIEEETL
jgi:predicted Zn-dependent protease